MKTTIVIALVVLAALCTVSDARRRREASFVELSGRAQASLCQIKDDSGNIQQWNCPFENPVCCSFSAKACCPTGYFCDESKAPVQCRKGNAGASVTNNGAGVQTINVFPKITINGPATSSPESSAPQEASGPSPAESSMGTGAVSGPSKSVGMGESSMASPMGESSSTQVRVPPFRQNIIIVKNINVLTKAQQPAPPPPKESSEESSERSERSESSESSRQESSERSEQSELSARS